MGVIRSHSDQKALREAARIAGAVCDELLAASEPGMSTVELEAQANQLLAKNRCSAPFKKFDNFGHACCISLNEEVVNGPPSRERVLNAGDLVSVALGSEYRGFHGKVARTKYLGEEVPADVQRLLTGTQAIFETIAAEPKKFLTLSKLAEAISQAAKAHQLTMVKDSGGYGIGKKLHDLPIIPNVPSSEGERVKLEEGLAFVPMPMMTLGSSGDWEIHADGWTQVLTDHSLCAHFAETILVTTEGLEILSRV